jgi:hypothetical protein
LKSGRVKMRRVGLLFLFCVFSWSTSAQNFVAIPATFYGDPFAVLTGISGSIAMSRASGNLPAFVHVSASGITAAEGTIYNGLGSALAAQPALRPYERFEYIWNFGDLNGTESFTQPVTHAIVNANNAQIGPEAAYVYRVAGTYTITLQVIGLGAFGSNPVLLNTFTTTFTASNPGNTSYYYDSNAADGGNGTQGAPWNALCNTTPITSACVLNTSNVNIYLACGSNFSADHVAVLSLNKSGGLSGVRINQWSNGVTCNNSNSASATNKPILEVTYSGQQPAGGLGALNLLNNNGKSDIVVSNLHLIVQNGNTTGGVIPLNLARGEGNAQNDIYFDNLVADQQSTVGGVASIYGGDNTAETSIQNDARSLFSDSCVWGGNYLISNSGNTTPSADIAFGAVQWQCFVGVTMSDYGSSSSTFNHVMNPETTCNHLLARWNKTNPGPGWNFLFQPRCGAWGVTNFTATATSGSNVLALPTSITGAVTVGDYLGQPITGSPTAIPLGNYVASCLPSCASPTTSITMGNAAGSAAAQAIGNGSFSIVEAAASLWQGGNVDVADNYFAGTPTLPLVAGIGQGLGFNNEESNSPFVLSPSKSGYYNGVVVERNIIGGVSDSIIAATGVTYITVRDNTFGAVGGYTYSQNAIKAVNAGGSSAATAPDGSSTAYAVYRNNILRDDSVQANANPIIGWFLDATLSSSSFGQEFGYNQLCDERASASNTSSVQMAQSTMPTTAQTSVFDWNTYWAPNASGAPSNPTIFLTTVGVSDPNEAFAAYQAANPIFDPNGSITKPGFCSP